MSRQSGDEMRNGAGTWAILFSAAIKESRRRTIEGDPNATDQNVVDVAPLAEVRALVPEVAGLSDHDLVAAIGVSARKSGCIVFAPILDGGPLRVKSFYSAREIAERREKAAPSRILEA